MNPEQLRVCATYWRNFAQAARVATREMIANGMPDLTAPAVIASMADGFADQLDERARELERTVRECVAS